MHCVSHPDMGYLGDARKRAIYAEFLEGMAERTAIWHALPREVASWWTLRNSAPDGASLGTGTAKNGEALGRIIFDGPDGPQERISTVPAPASAPKVT